MSWYVGICHCLPSYVVISDNEPKYYTFYFHQLLLWFGFLDIYSAMSFKSADVEYGCVPLIDSLSIHNHSLYFSKSMFSLKLDL